jgi:hypothetical protein
MKNKIKRSWREQEAFDDLKRLLKRGETIYCIVRHVSCSGMNRRIDLLVMRNGSPRYLSYQAAALLGLRCEGNGEGITIGGCGMDMGFALVYDLGRKLYPNGIKLRKGEWHNDLKVGDKYDAGYAFQHRWL